MPVLLTDFFIPAVAELDSIAIDVWLLGESVDGRRLLTSSQINRKCIVVQDMQTSFEIRYLKVR